MKRKISFAFFSLFAVVSLLAQSADPVILSYQRNFIRASIGTKCELLNDASRIASVTMTPLYIDALDFVHDNYRYLGNDEQLMDIAVAAAGKSVSVKDASILPSLMAVFSDVSDSRVRIACLNAFAVLAYKRPEEIRMLNEWFARNLALENADAKALAACASVLGKTGDASSFPVLFGAATGKYDPAVVDAAKSSINSLDEGYTGNILAILDKKGIQDMYAAFSIAMKKDSLPVEDRGRIAERAFTLASELADNATGQDRDALAALVRESIAELTALKWSNASPAVVKYFYAVQKNHDAGSSEQASMIAVVKCMGAMGTTDAAQALSIYLGLLNSETEQKKTYSEPLMLAVIQALGDLGDKSAFDYLLYVGYLDYPETVKKASRDALARLAW